MDRAALAHRRLQRNVNATLVVGFFQVFLVIMPIAVPFFQSKGLSMQEVFSLQAVFALVVLIAEVPSGYVADLVGRKQTLVLGAVFCGIGHTLLLLADGFWGLALFEVMLAIGSSLISGADLAMLYDSELALGRSEESQRQVVGRLYTARNVSEGLAAVLCSLLLLWSMDYAVYVQAVVGWLPLLASLLLVEPPGARLETHDHVGKMASICRYLFTHSRILRLAFLALCVWSLTTFYAVWLLQKLWQLQGVGLSHFGYLWAALSLVTALAGRWAHKIEKTVGPTALLLFIGLAPALGYVGLDTFGVVGQGNSAKLDITTISGPLLLEGDGTWNSRQGVRFSALASAEERERVRLQTLLGLIGRRQGKKTLIKIGA